ncbi:MAG: hypothetical protein ACYDH5_13060 [Acidimicrobiales bacterium]
MAASRRSLGGPGCQAGAEVAAPHPRCVSDRRLATARIELQGALQALDDLAAVVAEDERVRVELLSGERGCATSGLSSGAG